MILTERRCDFPLRRRGPGPEICLSAVTRYLQPGRRDQNTGIDPVSADGPNGAEDE